MIFIDTETTGLLSPEPANSFSQPYLTEIYIAKICPKTFKIKSEFETFVRPPIPIPELITKITGINDEMVEDAPSFPEIYDDLCDFVLGEREVVGHNVNFDMNVLRHELRRIGFELNFPWPCVRTCTIEMSYSIKNKRLKLGQLHELATGRAHEGSHRAKADVLATIECYKWLLSEGF